MRYVSDTQGTLRDACLKTTLKLKENHRESKFLANELMGASREAVLLLTVERKEFDQQKYMLA